MTAPTIASANYGNDSSATTSRAVTLPASHATGDLLVVNFGAPSGTITTPGGWSRLETTDAQWAVFYIVDTGSLGSTVTIATSASTRCAWTVFKVNAGTYEPSLIAKGTLATGSDTHPDPPSCSTGYTADTAYVALFKSPINNVATAYPTNYTGNQMTATSGSASYKVSVGQAVRTINGSTSDNPGTFTTGSTSGAWSAQTIALVPAGTSVISGTAASTFKFSESASGTIATGSSAVTFKFSESASGSEGVPGTAASTFKFSESATGGANNGTGGSSWKFSQSATGEQTYPPVTGTGASGWKFSESASGGALSGAGGSSWKFGQSATGEQTYPAVTGTGASSWKFDESATGVSGEPGVAGTAASTWLFSESASGAVHPTGTAASAFGWAASGGGAEGIAGASASAWGFSESADGTSILNATATGSSAWRWSGSADGLTAPLVTGSGASGWRFGEAAAAAESMTGTSAAAWKWRTWSGGLSSEPVTGTAHSTFRFAESAGGWEDPSATGTGASSWKFGEAATGVMHASGTAASTFRFAETASGWTDVTGDSAVSFKFADAVYGLEAGGTDVVGESHAVSFTWADQIMEPVGASGQMTMPPADTTWVTIA